MIAEIVSDAHYDGIMHAAGKGGYTYADVTLLTPNLQRTGLARDASYLVVESAYSTTIIRLDTEGRPVAILERS